MLRINVLRMPAMKRKAPYSMSDITSELTVSYKTNIFRPRSIL
jgi:hypothetical protein